MAKVVIKRNDTRTAIRATLLGPDRNPVDLTDATVRFLMADHKGTVKMDREALVPNAAGGEVWVVFESGDTDTVGLYRAEFEVTFPDGRIETYPNDRFILIQIVPDLG